MKRTARKYGVGDRFTLTADALENYGSQYVGKVFTVSSWADHYAKPEDCCGGWPNDPHGHPGFDSSAGSAIYEANGMPFAVYEWEMQAA